jgi:hypothetical protein
MTSSERSLSNFHETVRFMGTVAAIHYEYVFFLPYNISSKRDIHNKGSATQQYFREEQQNRH